MTKPLVPADLLKSLQAVDKPAADAGSSKPKAKPQPQPTVRASSKPQGKSGGAAHMRSSNRGK
ncbi:hypothetical protein GETHPA_03150 [Geothrix rubra]|uniref:Uncharacterized protein n=1 Tax=Geothrix rubra TaxID=2927977 RepID=A0ABQ5Q211_9BACT|nr:hypothetical protein [Geothrix rubra]GLH68782.1 hypothetical protein GETHPA_03150 [Geothrix rubra]